MTVKKNFLNIEAANVVAFFNQNAEESKKLPLKIRWALKRNIDALIPNVQNMDKFKTDVNEELRAEFFSEEKSDAIMIPQTDENGNPVKDEDGNEVLQEGRKVKPEFEEEFREKAEKLNKEMQELLVEKNVYEISTIDVDAFVESLPDDTEISFEYVEMLSFMDAKTYLVEGDE